MNVGGYKKVNKESVEALERYTLMVVGSRLGKARKWTHGPGVAVPVVVMDRSYEALLDIAVNFCQIACEIGHSVVGRPRHCCDTPAISCVEQGYLGSGMSTPPVHLLSCQYSGRKCSPRKTF
jgi:hypothetical protein